MRANSLAFRLIAAASLWSALALVVAGVVLTSIYRQNAERGFDDRLGVYLNSLIGALAEQPPVAPIAYPGNLGEQLFELLYSGWYWQIREPDDGRVLLASHSLFSDTLDIAGARNVRNEGGIETGILTGPDNQTLRVLSQTVTFTQDHRYDVLVAGDVSDLEVEIATFRTTVVVVLAVFGIGLILAALTQIRWGLRPLDRVRAGLANLRSGQQTRFEEGGLPAEVEPLVKELNALLESNQDIIARARTQVGNLAHALKTPLSVILNEARASRTPLGVKVAEQAQIMRKQINHYLDRARIAGQLDIIGAVTEVDPTISRLARAMRRIHGERGIELDYAGANGARFKGEQQDLEEVVGNLVDNACKWARSSVAVSVDYAAPNGEGTGRLAIFIDDDGPGLTEAEMAAATERGRRLDESKPGSGLGLSIVTDLVAMYSGAFRLSRSPSGGLRAEVDLPAA
jgi:signal transduction histidine kinase